MEAFERNAKKLASLSKKEVRALHAAEFRELLGLKQKPFFKWEELGLSATSLQTAQAVWTSAYAIRQGKGTENQDLIEIVNRYLPAP
jgi:hypothetical protein